MLDLDLDFAHSPSLVMTFTVPLLKRELMIFNFSHTGEGRPETHTRGAGVELLDYEKRVDNRIIVP